MEMRISFEGVVCHIVSRQYEQCCGAVPFFGQLRLRFFKIHSNRTLVLNFFSFKSFHKVRNTVYTVWCMQDKKFRPGRLRIRNTVYTVYGVCRIKRNTS